MLRRGYSPKHKFSKLKTLYAWQAKLNVATQLKLYDSNLDWRGAQLHYPPLGVEVQPLNASESQVNTTCATHTKRNYKTMHIRHETQDISHKT